MNAYRFKAIKTPDLTEEAKAELLGNANKHAKLLQSSLPDKTEDLQLALDKMAFITANEKKSFIAILYNDLGKYLKDTAEPHEIESTKNALIYLKRAIKTAPEGDPAGIFAREAWVDAHIKLNSANLNKPGNWPSLFDKDILAELKSRLDEVISLTEKYGNKKWKAYIDADTRLKELNNFKSITRQLRSLIKKLCCPY